MHDSHCEFPFLRQARGGVDKDSDIGSPCGGSTYVQARGATRCVKVGQSLIPPEHCIKQKEARMGQVISTFARLSLLWTVLIAVAMGRAFGQAPLSEGPANGSTATTQGTLVPRLVQFSGELTF